MRLITIAALILALAIGVYAFFTIQALYQQVESLQSQVESLQEDLRALHLPDEISGQVTIYLVESLPTDFVLTPVIREIPYSPTPVAALQELIRGPSPNEDLHPAVPKETRLLGIEISDGLANTNFSRELQTEFNGGAQLEALLVDAIVHTLTHFDHIDEVQILVEGEVVESIAGHVGVDKPISAPLTF